MPKKPNDDRKVVYLRVKPQDHARLTRIAEARGYPHSIASVATEMCELGLAADAQRARRKLPKAG